MRATLAQSLPSYSRCAISSSTHRLGPAFTLAHHPRLRRASGAHRIDGVGKPLALALHALTAGNLTFAGGIARSVANLDLTLSLVMADDQAICRDAGPSQLERMRRRAVGEQLFAAAKHDRHCEDAHSVDQVLGEQRVDEFGTALGDEVRAVVLLQALHVGDVAQEHRARPARIDLA